MTNDEETTVTVTVTETCSGILSGLPHVRGVGCQCALPAPPCPPALPCPPRQGPAKPARRRARAGDPWRPGARL